MIVTPKIRVDPLSAIPKYYQLSEIIRHKIEAEEWQPHDPIPPERELETLYNVSRTTVREALNHLEDQGYIYREHGRGTFVARPKMQHSLHSLQSFTDDMKARGFIAGQKLLELNQINPPIRVKQQLNLPDEQTVISVKRLRYADDEPIGIQTAYIPLPSNQTIIQEELDQFGSLYALLENKFGLLPIEADATLEATAATQAEAVLLNI
ncbi:MAG: GntR family transcriptional regulator, partial [Chloroflexota bacterium]